MAFRNMVSRGFRVNHLLLKRNELECLGPYIRSASSNAPSKPTSKKSTTKSTTSSKPSASFTYNSAATPAAPSEPIGPGAAKDADYKNPEYYSYNEMSYFDLELEMMKDRNPQPKSGNEEF